MDPKERQERLDICNKLIEKVNILVWHLKKWFYFNIAFAGRIVEIQCKSQTAIGIDSNERKATAE